MNNSTRHTTASGPSAHDHATRYEALRAHAMERHTPPIRDGLVVLLRQGLVAWMDAWSRLPVPPPRPVPAERQQESDFPNDASAEVVRVLAAMTLGHFAEVRA